jgi:hypothetical protein
MCCWGQEGPGQEGGLGEGWEEGSFVGLSRGRKGAQGWECMGREGARWVWECMGREGARWVWKCMGREGEQGVGEQEGPGR